MIARRIRPEEVIECFKLFSIVFELPFKGENDPELFLEKIRENPKSREDLAITDKFAVFEDDDRTMISCIFRSTLPTAFYGHKVDMACIGGVSTLPSHRRRGYIRDCFQLMFDAAFREEEVVLSYLYPFSYRFYNQFGYARGAQAKKVKIDLSRLPRNWRSAVKGQGILVTQENRVKLLPEFYTVFRRYTSEYNCITMNEDIEFRFVLEADPSVNGEYVYLYLSEDGSPKGYMSYSKSVSDGGRDILCKRFAYADSEGLRGLLSIAQNCAADHKHIIFTIPENRNVEPVLDEFAGDSVHQETIRLGQVRVIKVKRALELAEYNGSGEVTFGITDKMLPQNEGIYVVRYKDGKAENVQYEPFSTTDVKVPVLLVDRFSEFICNNYPVQDLIDAEDCQASPEELQSLDKVFIRRKAFICEYF